jgi:hypothetical protein
LEEIRSPNGVVRNDPLRPPGNLKPQIAASRAPFGIPVEISNHCPLTYWVGLISAGSIGPDGFREVLKHGRRHEHPNRCYGPKKTRGSKKHDAEIRAA